MSAPQDPMKVFGAAADKAMRRLLLADWLRLLARTALIVFAVALVLWIVLRVSGARDSWWWAAALIVAWLAGAFVFAWLRRLAAFDALAAWDRTTGRREMFASAWFFETAAVEDRGAQLHLQKAGEILRDRQRDLRRDLPLPFSWKLWAPPLLFIVFALSGVLRAPVSAEDRALSDATRTQAAEAGKQLAQQVAALDPLNALTEEEKEKLQHLKAELDQASKKMEEIETPRDLLEELERRARETEKLAEALRSDDLGALSAGMLAELERNADTADLGNALRSQDLGRVAEEARMLEARLGDKKLTLEEQKRIEEALKKALEAANEKDRRSKTGQQLAEAQRQLSSGDRSAAAQQFGNLAQQFGRAAQRQQAQNQLRNLAQSFRGAGQQILGGQNLQRLMPQAPPGMQSLPQLAPGPMNPGGAPLNLSPMPGHSQGRPLAAIPIPGTQSGSPRGAMPFPVPGAGQQPGAGAIPIPGTNPGAGAPQGGMGFPIPGAGAPMPGGGMAGAGGSGADAGGSEAGSGTTGLGNDPTKPLTANQTGVVAPAPGADGPSSVTAVAGEAHRETAARSRQEIAMEFLKAEEAALAEEPLPNSRRQQVLLYFTALRQQLEGQE